MKSAIDWDLVTRAKRAQGKLARYFELLEEVKQLEADPDVAPFLSSGEGVLPQPTAQDRVEAEESGVGPQPVAPLAPQQEDPTLQPAVSAPKPYTPRVPRRYIERSLMKVGEPEFDAQEVLAKFRDSYPSYPWVDVRLVNDHLRRMEKANVLERTETGRRGRRGSLPKYRRVVKVQANSTS